MVRHRLARCRHLTSQNLAGIRQRHIEVAALGTAEGAIRQDAARLRPNAQALAELLYNADAARSTSYNASPIVLAGIIYLVFLWPCARFLARLQNRMSQGELGRQVQFSAR